MSWNFWGDPATWLWGGVWVALAVGVWVVVKGVRGFRLPSTACGACGYDLVGTVNQPCPECGGRRDRATVSRGQRRRWGQVGIGLGAIAVASMSRMWVDPAADWIWWRVLPAGVYMGEYEAGGLRWRWWAMREGRESPRELWDYFGERHEVLHPLAGWTFVSEGGLGLDLFTPTNGESTDFDGDGVDETIVHDLGGEEECRTFVINSRLREHPVAELECRPWSGAKPYPRDVDGDGITELIVPDSTFVGWSSNGELAAWSSTGVPVVLGWTGSRFEVKVSLMRGAAMGSGMAPLDRRRGTEPHLFWDVMLDMMYSGNEADAWAYFDRVWPDTRPGKAKFKREFLERLETSPSWPKIREAYARGE